MCLAAESEDKTTQHHECVFRYKQKIADTTTKHALLKEWLNVGVIAMERGINVGDMSGGGSQTTIQNTMFYESHTYTLHH